jgi:glycosyltransferase involved in cell wall biosynthesis
MLIVDDGSTDRTVEIIKQYAEKDSRITFIQSDHGGGPRARNIAAKVAKYPWIAMMDADDIAYPDRLEKQLKAAEADPEVVVWGAFMTQINRDGQPTYQIEVGPTSKEACRAIDRTKELIRLYNPAAMLNREIFEKVNGYDERLLAAQDSELWDRMAEYGPVVVLPEPLLYYRVHDKQISITRLSEQRILHGFPIARNQAKAEGKDLSLDEYLKAYHGAPLHVRLARFSKHRGEYYYRKAARHRDKKEYPAMLASMALSALIRPQWTIPQFFRKAMGK